MNYILVLNAGSSSIKFRMYEKDNLKEIASALCERIGIDGLFKISYKKDGVDQTFEEKANFKNHELAIDYCIKKLTDLKIINELSEIVGIGHRVVQGGEINKSSLIDKDVLNSIEKCIKLAPLHNKPELDVIKIIMKKIPNSKSVAVFDTSFHTTIPSINSYYPIPKKWVDSYKIKKYGFHGTSYRYIYENTEKILKKNRPLNIIVCHLGNGASVCCIKNGSSYDTTMGFTPMAGLIMGTRCGDIDPSIADYLINQEKNSPETVFSSFNKESGLKAICGSSDFRDIKSNILPGNDFELARKIFIQKVSEFVVKYINHLEGKVDAIVFTGGIGENDYTVTKDVCDNIFIKKIKINNSKNASKYSDYKIVSSLFSSIKVIAMRTNEELKIAQDTKALL